MFSFPLFVFWVVNTLLKNGPESTENEINEILGSKRRYSDHSF